MSKISVLMSVWAGDCPLLYERALRSITDQEHSADEIVIIFDGPVHSSIDTLTRKLSTHHNIKVHKLRKNTGLASALNYGLAKCKHELIARMDADDICYPSRLKCQIRFMDANPHIAASSAYVDEMDTNGKIISQRRLPCDENSLRKFAKYRSPLNHPLAIFRRDVVVELGGYPLFRKAQDFALWSLLLKNGHKLGNVDTPLLAMQTGESFLKRRSFNHLQEEIKVIIFQWQIGWIDSIEFFISVGARVFLRLSPSLVKSFAYKVFRK